MLFDGIPIASGFEGTIDLNEIATEQVAGIKVLKSAPSVIYGTNGMGGVIDILPRNGTDASLLAGEFEVGTDNRLLARASSGAGNGNLSYLLSLSHDRAEDYALSDDYRGELNQPPGDRVNSDYRRDSVFLSLDAQQTPAGHLSLFYNLSDAEKGLPPTAGVEDPDYQRLTRSRRQTVGVSDRLSSIPLAVKAYYNSYDSDLTTYTDGTYTMVDDVEKTQDYSYGVKLYSTRQMHPNNTIVLHAAGQSDVFEGEGQLEDGNRAEITTWTAAVEDQFLITKTLSLAAGGSTTCSTRRCSIDPALHSTRRGLLVTTDRLALTCSPRSARAFRSFASCTGAGTATRISTRNTAENYEIGFTFAHTSRYQSDVAVFHSDVDGLIERPDRRSTYENLPKVTIDGVEASTGGWVFDQLPTRLVHLRQGGRTCQTARAGSCAAGPEHTAQAEVRYRFPWQMVGSANGIYIAGLHDLDDNDVYVKLDSYFVANLKTSKVFNDTLSGDVAVTNLLDENYDNASAIHARAVPCASASTCSSEHARAALPSPQERGHARRVGVDPRRLADRGRIGAGRARLLRDAVRIHDAAWLEQSRWRLRRIRSPVAAVPREGTSRDDRRREPAGRRRADRRGRGPGCGTGRQDPRHPQCGRAARGASRPGSTGSGHRFHGRRSAAQQSNGTRDGPEFRYPQPRRPAAPVGQAADHHRRARCGVGQFLHRAGRRLAHRAEL